MTEQLRAVTGTVFNIQHYCIHDGPGIRTNVFVKGCPLHCAWCANPESQSGVPQLMYLADRCTGCGACIAACEKQAVSRRTDRPDRVATDRAVCTA
ncbi:MAG: 4Fe-4S cluster-binding domain-containing protein, partial [Muribaculaceae bacterium]|nr:4Fe-4S cluster-binding domain-containing protein [Muribaculaceae bacterium]